MSEEIVKEILVEGVDARELYGTQNAYLEQMRELCPKVKIVARGDKIKALGARSDVAAFERRMNALVDYYVKYGHISSELQRLSNAQIRCCGVRHKQCYIQ